MYVRDERCERVGLPASIIVLFVFPRSTTFIPPASNSSIIRFFDAFQKGANARYNIHNSWTTSPT